MKKASILGAIIGCCFIAGCSGGGSDPEPKVGEVATSEKGAADIQKNGIPKPSGSVPSVDR